MVSNIILREHKVRSVYALMIHSCSQSYVATFALLVGLQKLGGLIDSLYPFYCNLFVMSWQTYVRLEIFKTALWCSLSLF